MGLRINSNISSLGAQRSLAEVLEKLRSNYRKLSTGLRITRAGDDAAGLAVAERLRARITSLDQARRNANDGISLVQTAESALGEASSILNRMREIAIQANNSTLSSTDKNTLNAEFSALISEVNRIAQSTDFNGIKLLDGSSSNLDFQVGFGTTGGVDTLAVSLSPALSTTLGIQSLDVGASGNASAAIAAVDSAIDTVSSLRGSLGAAQNRLGSAVTTIGAAIENLAAAESRIRDVDIARETASLSRNSIIQQASLAILSQANALPSSALKLLG